MPRIPEETIEEIRRRADIVSVVETYVQLQKRSQEFWGCCPFHEEKTPSFKLSPSHQTYHCFGCGAGGNVFQFIMSRENVDFPGAIHLLAQRFNVIIPEPPDHPKDQAPRVSGRERAQHKETLFSCLREIGEWYQQSLWRNEGEPARRYLKQRGFDRKSIDLFGIGFAPDSWEAALQWGERHQFPPEIMLECGLVIKRDDKSGSRVYDRFRYRIMFPIRDELGRIIGFSGRTLEPDAKSAKYINTPETALFHKGKLLYGLDLARTNLKKHGFALVCEGQLDVIACHGAGFDNAMAPQGTAFTENQARILKRFTPAVTFAFDSDPAGLKAAAKSIEIALRMELKPKVVTLPEGEDPASVFQSKGPETLRQILADADDAMEFLFNFASRSHDPKTPYGKDAIAWFLIDIFSGHPSPVLRSAYCQWLSGRLDVPESAIFDMLNRRLRETATTRQRQTNEPVPAVLPRNETVQPPNHRTRLTGERREAAILDLLDLTIHHGFLAHQLMEKLNRELLGHNPLAMALNLVLDETAKGKHAESGKKLAAEQTLSSDHLISRVLAGSRYPVIPLESDASNRRKQVEELLQRAMDDCLAVIELETLEQNLQQLDREIEDEKEPEKQRAKLLEYQKLVQRSRQLQNNHNR